jgi:hypothetical protein
VAIVAGLRQGELQTSLDPLRAVMRNPKALSDLIGGLEPNPHTSPASRYGSRRTTSIASSR